MDGRARDEVGQGLSRAFRPAREGRFFTGRLQHERLYAGLRGGAAERSIMSGAYPDGPWQSVETHNQSESVADVPHLNAELPPGYKGLQTQNANDRWHNAARSGANGDGGPEQK